MPSFDRLPSDELQELIANLPGVRREGVTEAAGNLQKAGLIKYSRGHITVLDRAGLEARVCARYAVVKQEFERLLPEVRVPQEPVGLRIDLLRWWESGTYFPDFSLRRMTLRLDIVKICSRSPTMLATIT